jgi:hypothetical protein
MASFQAQTEPYSGLTPRACILLPCQLVSRCLLQWFKFHTQRLLLSGWLLNNVQVNIITTLHDIWHACIYVHHTSITIHFFFLYIFYFPGQAGCPPLALFATVTVQLRIHNMPHSVCCGTGRRFGMLTATMLESRPHYVCRVLPPSSHLILQKNRLALRADFKVISVKMYVKTSFLMFCNSKRLTK